MSSSQFVKVSMARGRIKSAGRGVIAIKSFALLKGKTG
jgi:hypothetical protein